MLHLPRESGKHWNKTNNPKYSSNTKLATFIEWFRWSVYIITPMFYSNKRNNISKATIHEENLKRQLVWYGYVERMGHERLPKW